MEEKEHEHEYERDTQKQRLLDAFFGIPATHQTKELRALSKELKRFTETYGSDRQIDDVITLVKMSIMSRKNDDFEKRCRLSKSILQRMDELATWELTDLRILSITALISRDFDLVSRLFDRALFLLNTEYTTAPFYEKAMCALYYNVSGTLLRLSYLFAANDSIIDEIKAKLQTCLDIACERSQKLFAKDKAYQVFYGTALVRKGLFLDEQLIIDKGVKLVKETRDAAAKRLLEEEIQAYEFTTKNKVGKHPFRKHVSANVRMHREMRNLSIFELAELAGIHYNTVSQIESGALGMSDYVLYRVARALNVSMEDLVIDPIELQEEITSNELLYWFDKAGKMNPVNQFAVLNYIKFTLSEQK